MLKYLELKHHDASNFFSSGSPKKRDTDKANVAKGLTIIASRWRVCRCLLCYCCNFSICLKNFSVKKGKHLNKISYSHAKQDNTEFSLL